MASSFASSLDALGLWRAGLGRRLDDFNHFLAQHDLADPAAAEALDTLRRGLVNEKLVVAFVAEFSRGKSELINAIFFADTGRPRLPKRSTRFAAGSSTKNSSWPSLPSSLAASRN